MKDNVDYNNVKDNPDIERGTIFNVGNYICEVDDYNDDNPNESIVFIYKSQKDYEYGDYFETISLSNMDIKTNIENYMRENYKVGISITKLSLLEELKEQIESNLMSYSKNYLMSEPQEEYEVEWEFEVQKLKLVNEMIAEERNKKQLEKKDKERESL